MLFKCDWFDPTQNGTRLLRKLGLVEVHKNRRFNRYEPFILAIQAHQVYYLPYPAHRRRERSDWLAICKLQPKFVDETNAISSEMTISDNAFQADQNENMDIMEVDVDPLASAVVDPTSEIVSDNDEFETNADDEEDDEFTSSSDSGSEDEFE
ncbi:hypothetical protein Scep_006788 [Stephania cephalantha]|uniref:DUF4216 domain-containing protein n=1 Tax=Stephania cephalantha TaxID=152367 RepID=A0AAP0PPD7_9MAGN